MTLCLHPCAVRTTSRPSIRDISDSPANPSHHRSASNRFSARGGAREVQALFSAGDTSRRCDRSIVTQRMTLRQMRLGRLSNDGQTSCHDQPFAVLHPGHPTARLAYTLFPANRCRHSMKRGQYRGQRAVEPPLMPHHDEQDPTNAPQPTPPRQLLPPLPRSFGTPTLSHRGRACGRLPRRQLDTCRDADVARYVLESANPTSASQHRGASATTRSI